MHLPVSVCTSICNIIIVRYFTFEYVEWPAKPLPCTVYRTGNRKQLGRGNDWEKGKFSDSSEKQSAFVLFSVYSSMHCVHVDSIVYCDL